MSGTRAEVEAWGSGSWMRLLKALGLYFRLGLVVEYCCAGQSRWKREIGRWGSCSSLTF